jgi:glycosyltransferase involved in cell wall biosynthesis
MMARHTLAPVPQQEATRLLVLGPRHSIHVRRWSELARDIGCRVFVAGDVHPGTTPVDLEGVAEQVFNLPHRPSLAAVTRAQAFVCRSWVRRLVRRLRPDVIHAHWLLTWGLWAASADRHPLVVTAWGSDVYLAQGLHERNAQYALDHADHVTAPSPAMVDEIVRRGIPPERVSHVDLGVDLTAFRPPSDHEREAARDRLGLGDEPVILSFRAGQPNYNLPLIARGFARLRESLPDARLLVIHGHAPLDVEANRALGDPAIADAVRVDGNVTHERMPGYFAVASAGVSIPTSDGSPRSVWEGLACGVPMVVSDLPQVSGRLEGTGAAIPVAIEEEAVAAALERILSEPERASQMGEAGVEWARANVDYAESVRALERTYSGLLDD